MVLHCLSILFIINVSPPLYFWGCDHWKVHYLVSSACLMWSHSVLHALLLSFFTLYICFSLGLSHLVCTSSLSKTVSLQKCLIFVCFCLFAFSLSWFAFGLWIGFCNIIVTRFLSFSGSHQSLNMIICLIGFAPHFKHLWSLVINHTASASGSIVFISRLDFWIHSLVCRNRSVPCPPHV